MNATKPPPGQAAQIKAMTKNRRRTLKESFVRSQPPGPKEQTFPDALVPGFKLRIRPSGHKSFILRIRLNPRASSAVNLDLGTVGQITLADARVKAREWIQQIKAGTDPRAAVKAERASTFAAAAELFLARHVRCQRRGKAVEREIRNELIGRWGNMPLTAVKRQHVIEMTSAIVERGKRAQARNVLIN